MTSRRRSKRAVTLVEEIEQFPATQSLWWSDEAASAVSSGRVRRAVATALTEKQREVVEAFFFEGRSQGEIARELGISQQVVQKRIFGTQRGDKMVGGALSRLRTALSDPEQT